MSKTINYTQKAAQKGRFFIGIYKVAFMVFDRYYILNLSIAVANFI